MSSLHPNFHLFAKSFEAVKGKEMALTKSIYDRNLTPLPNPDSEMDLHIKELSLQLDIYC
jgi:hypothetical protein